MYLNRIILTNFKNYVYQQVELSPRLNCFAGLNGMGKTNLLDAVHLLCLCKSHTGLTDRSLVKRGESFFRVEGWFINDTEQAKVAAKYSAGGRKEMERNGYVYPRLADYIGQFPVVMIAPADVDLVEEGSEERRRFLDTTLCQLYPDYLNQLIAYNHLLRQRNALLKSFAENRTYDPVLLEALDRQLPEPAARLYTWRMEFTQRFAPVFREVYAEISGGREQVDVKYGSDLEEQPLENWLSLSLDRDRLLERTTRGVHRDDLELLLDGHPVKRFASQGQLKSFLLALRLAQYELLRLEKQQTPLLLLDDIFDKLDAERVRQLIGLLLTRQYGQLFITDTQRDRLERIIVSFTGEYKMFEVENGIIKD